MSASHRLQLDPALEQSPGLAPLFRLASQASAVAPLVADQPMQAFRSGWHLFDAVFADGERDATQLVVDYGEGFAWLERLSPRYPAANGKLRSVVAIKREPRAFGLLAGRNGHVPTLVAAGLQPIGRGRALLELLRGIHASAPRGKFSRAVAATGVFLRTLYRHGRKAAATALVERYEATSRGATDYATWLTANEKLVAPPPVAAPQHPAYRAPVFSLLMVFDPAHREGARRSLQSVQGQTWTTWQMCIAHGRTLPPMALAELHALAKAEPRILLVPCDVHAPSDAWLAALSAATGGYCARLECGDQLALHALQDIASALVQQPSAGFLYSDHDLVDDAGVRSAPSFKQDWSPDVSCHRDTMLQLAMVQRDILMQMGHHAAGDPFDVALRACDASGPDRIVHVPRVLYHRSLHAPRVSADDVAGLQALQAHLARKGQDGRASVAADGVYRVAYPVPNPAPSVEVLVPTRDQRKLLARCMDGVLNRTDYPNLRVRIIDNDSRDPEVLELLARLALDPRVSLRHAPGAFNFSRIINQAARESDAQLLCVLNDDVVTLEPGWLHEMVSQALRPEIGAVGAMLQFPDGSVQHAGVVTGVGGVAGHVHYRLQAGDIAACPELATLRNYSVVTAACMVMTRERFQGVGGFDEGLPVCYNDVDICLRLRAQGYFNVWTPFAVLAHHEAATRGPDDTPLKRARHQREFARMLARWGDRLNRDPAYNPNLSLYGEPFELAHAPRATGNLVPAYPSQPERSPSLESMPVASR